MRLTAFVARFALPAAFGVLSAMQPLAGDEPASTPSWTPCGWGGGAYYYSAAWNPSNGNIIYMGGDCAGLYRTESKGKLWGFANKGVSCYEVLCLATTPASPDLVYAMTADGLFKSSDAAKSWTHLAETGAKKLEICSTKHSSVRAVAIDLKNPETVYAGSRNGKLFKSSDGGSSWTELPYRDALPKQDASPAFLGKGSLVLTYDAQSAGMDNMGRVSKFYGQGKEAKDWSAYKKLSARLLLPAGAPALEAQLVVQSGDSWLWQTGPWTELKPGEWTEAALDLSAIKSPDSIRMIHLVLRSPKAPYHGDVYLDAVALHSEASGALSQGQAPDPKDAVLVADWEKVGELEGWSANREYKDSLHIVEARQSLKKKGGDVVSCVALVPGSPSTVYVSNTRSGIFRSDDAGASWLSLKAPKGVYAIAASSKTPDVVWAACGEDGVFMSSDRGASWSAMNGDLKMAYKGKKLQVKEVYVHPSKPDTVYAVASASWDGFFLRTDDGGKSWSVYNKLRTGLPGNPTNPEETGSGDFEKGFANLSVAPGMAVNPGNPDEIFLAANWRNAFSSDGGRTWEERSTGADNTCVTDIQFFGSKTYVSAMDEGLLVSENSGGLWKQLIPLKYDENVSGHFWRVRLSQGEGSSIHIVTSSSPWKSFGDQKCANRVFVSDDSGASFSCSISGLPDYVPQVNCMWGRSFPRALAADPNNPKVLYLGMDGDPEPGKGKQGGGVFRSSDGGKTWTRCAGQPGGRRMFYGLAVDPSDSKRLFWASCGNGGGVWRSEDEGASWENVFKGESWLFNLDVAPSGAVFAGGKDLYRSVDHGKTWQKISSFQNADATIVGIAIDPADEQRVWVSKATWDFSDRGGVFQTLDGGKTWTEITGDIPYRKPLLLRYNPASKELWAGGVGLFRMKI